MIHSLYQFTNKGSFRTLSFILAFILTTSFLFNISGFSVQFRSLPIVVILLVLWGCVVLWIHGIGFVIEHMIWRLCFMPVIGEILGFWAIFYGFIH